MKRLLFIAIALLFAETALGSDRIQIFVAPQGNNQSEGTLDSPLADIAAARDWIRQKRQSEELADTLIEVILQPGHYTHGKTIEFTEADSGSQGFPIVYKAAHEGTVIISGGVGLHGWKELDQPELLQRLPRDARSHVTYVKLSDFEFDAGNLQARRLHEEMPSPALRLFDGTKILPRAGWPNHDWAIAKSAAVKGKPTWKLDRPIHAQDATHVWAHGFWQHDRSDSLERITLRADRRTASINSTNALQRVSVREGARFRIVNALSELDAPGEWYLDSMTGLLMLWPPSEVPSNALRCSVVDTLLSAYDLEHVRFEGLRFESAKLMAVEVAGGCEVELVDCVVADAGQIGVHLFRGKQHRLLNCEVYCTGSSAVRVEAGDRPTLTHSEHAIHSCDIHDFCQEYLAGRPAIAVYGVGTTVAKCRIHDGPDSAICLFGNEHVIEQNEITRVCRETDDTGAIYLGYDPTFRGNVIRKNYIHDLVGFSKTGIMGIYLDDFASGTTVTENYLCRLPRGIAIGGGSHNTIAKNFIHDTLAAIQLDARGQTWANQLVKNQDSPIRRICQHTLDHAAILLDKYPELADTLEDKLAIPTGNLVAENEFHSPIGIDLQNMDTTLVSVHGNVQISSKQMQSLGDDPTSQIINKLGIELRSKKENRGHYIADTSARETP